MKKWIVLFLFIQGCSEKRKVSPAVPEWFTNAEAVFNNSLLESVKGSENYLDSTPTESTLCSGLAAPIFFNCQPRFLQFSIQRSLAALEAALILSKNTQLVPGNIDISDTSPILFDDLNTNLFPFEIMKVLPSQVSLIGFETQQFVEAQARLPFFNFKTKENSTFVSFNVNEFPLSLPTELEIFQIFRNTGKSQMNIVFESENSWNFDIWNSDLKCQTGLSRSAHSEFISIKLSNGIIKTQYSGLIPRGAQGFPTDLLSPPDCTDTSNQDHSLTSQDFLLRIESKSSSLATQFKFYLVPGDQNISESSAGDFDFDDACDRFGWDCTAASLDLSTLDNLACLNKTTQALTWGDDCASLDPNLGPASFLDFSKSKTAAELIEGPSIELESSTQSLTDF